MSSQPLDHAARAEALNPCGSYIVQAPAGSGKTQILIQRILGLLALADEPENILAITFTNKAASEMRNRVMEALAEAQLNIEPAAEPSLTTFKLARKVLHRSDERGWELESNPGRLQLLTIDSLCSSIAKTAPVTNSFGTIPQISENPNDLYRKAAKATLRQLEQIDNPVSADIEKLLVHLDNNMPLLEDLIISMLSKRQQWLQFVVPLSESDRARKYLEDILSGVIADKIELVNSLVSDSYKSEVMALVKTLHQVMIDSGDPSPYTEITDDLDVWKNAAKLLLTSTYSFRARLTKAQGVYAPSSSKDKNHKASLEAIKVRAMGLLNVAESQYPQLSELLATIDKLPEPGYTDEQWSVMTALISILKHSVAHLKIVFAESSEADFTEISQAALSALGHSESPSDFALSLDYKVQHILIDEFQDTSISQFQLLQMLTSGWQEGDGRTVFLVGDPMQAIYRFRDAEVANFIIARQFGLPNMTIQPLYLTQNFRSKKTLVESFNTVFETVFSDHDSLSTGDVSFSAAQPFHGDNEHTNFSVDAVVSSGGRELEAMVVAEKIKQAQALNPNGSVAVLGRSRNHLAAIASQLKKEGISYNAVEMDKLSNNPLVQDVLSLARAIYRLGDHAAWLGLLRQPVLGLSLKELFDVANYASEHHITIFQALQNEDLLTFLSEETQQKLDPFMNIMRGVIQNRELVKVGLNVESAVEQMGYLSLQCYEDSRELIAPIVDFISSASEDYQLLSYHKINERLDRLYSSTTGDGSSNVHLMTIHKSKGLQFDTVILPGLDRTSGRHEASLLQWQMVYGDNAQEPGLLLAPLKPASEQEDSTYQFVTRVGAEFEQQEMKRLLYVAMTRAKSRLHLVYQLAPKGEDDYQPPKKGSLIYPAWFVFNQFQTVTFGSDLKPTTVRAEADQPRKIARTIDSRHFQAVSNENNAEKRSFKVNSIENRGARAIGELVHLELELFSRNGGAGFSASGIKARSEFYRSYLIESGAFSQGHKLNKAVSEVISLLAQASTNSKLRQYLKNPVDQSKSEFEVQALRFGSVKTFRVDRLYVDDTGATVIDYKTDRRLPDEDLGRFVARLKQEHEQQLKDYTFALSSEYPSVKSELYLVAENMFVAIR